MFQIRSRSFKFHTKTVRSSSPKYFYCVSSKQWHLRMQFQILLPASGVKKHLKKKSSRQCQLRITINKGKTGYSSILPKCWLVLIFCWSVSMSAKRPHTLSPSQQLAVRLIGALSLRPLSDCRTHPGETSRVNQPLQPRVCVCVLKIKEVKRTGDLWKKRKNWRQREM